MFCKCSTSSWNWHQNIIHYLQIQQILHCKSELMNLYSSFKDCVKAAPSHVIKSSIANDAVQKDKEKGNNKQLRTDEALPRRDIITTMMRVTIITKV